MEKSSKIRRFPWILACFVTAGPFIACAPTKPAATQPGPREKTVEPAPGVGRAKLGLYGTYYLHMTKEGWPEAYVKGKVLFDEAVTLHEQEDYAAAAARFLQAAASFASVPSSSSFAPTILKNRDLSCANARFAFINGGLETKLEAAARGLAAGDPDCAKKLQR